MTVSTIANLSQGEMAGTISDDFVAPLKYKRFHGRIDALAHEASPTTKMPIKEIPDLNPAFRIIEGESEEDRQNRVKIMVRENYESIKKDLVLLQYLEIIRFQFQKVESQDINLEILAEGMLNYIIKTNKYITKDGLSPQRELFMDKLEIMNTIFGNNIAHKIALSEIESQDNLIGGKIIQAEKKLYSDYQSEECQGLQAHYREFFRIYGSASVTLPSDEYYDGDDF